MHHLTIGLTGPIAAGKSALAAALVATLADTLPVEIRPFATPVKQAALDLGWNGEKDAKGRRLLQLLGTDIGRDLIDPDIWLNKWLDSAIEYPASIIADDVRFPNEAQTIRDLGGTIVQVLRPDAPTLIHPHPSEAGLPASLIDITLPIHDGPLALQAAARRLANMLRTS
jgi:hypothetical protein